MRQAGVPIVPGCDVVRDAEQAKQEAEKIGFPLLIKARAGGGGRGIRKVTQQDALEGAVRRATDFTRLCVERSMRFPTPVNYGVDLEPLLPLLWEDAANKTRE